MVAAVGDESDLQRDGYKHQLRYSLKAILLPKLDKKYLLLLYGTEPSAEVGASYVPLYDLGGQHASSCLKGTIMANVHKRIVYM